MKTITPFKADGLLEMAMQEAAVTVLDDPQRKEYVVTFHRVGAQMLGVHREVALTFRALTVRARFVSDEPTPRHLTHEHTYPNIGSVDHAVETIVRTAALMAINGLHAHRQRAA
jgi:hypothetical protein